MIIYRPNERVTVKIGPVSIVICPLTPQDKMKIANVAVRGSDQVSARVLPLAYETLKLAVKEIDAPGFEFSDGKPITLAKGPDGTLSDDGLAVLLQIVDSQKLIPFAAQLAAHGVKDWGIEGVEIVRVGPEEKKSQENPPSA